MSKGKMNKQDALDKLIVDEDENPNINLLAEIVSEYLRFTNAGEIIFEKKFYSLKELQKFIIFLLGRKAISIKKLQKDFEEKVNSKDISQELGIKSATIRKYVSKDLKDLIKSDKGKYFIPNYNLYKCKEKLSNGKSNNKKSK